MLPLDLKIVILQFLEPKKITNYFLDELYRNPRRKERITKDNEANYRQNDKEYIKLYESKYIS